MKLRWLALLGALSACAEEAPAPGASAAVLRPQLAPADCAPRAERERSDPRQRAARLAAEERWIGRVEIPGGVPLVVVLALRPDNPDAATLEIPAQGLAPTALSSVAIGAESLDQANKTISSLFITRLYSCTLSTFK